MAKSISLSSDMKTLYYINDDSITTSFSLAGNGVFITSIIGEVHVVAASSQLTNGADDFNVNDASQWQMAYHEDTVQAVMIGIDDLEAGITELKTYDLTKGKVINLRLNAPQTKLLIRT